jgi:hypothetical protein
MSSPMTPLILLTEWVHSRVAGPSSSWFDDRLAALRQDAIERDLVIALGLVPRKLGKGDLALSAEELDRARAARDGWDPRDWTIDQAARLALLLARGDQDAQGLHAQLEQLFGGADVGEQICLYRGLPLYPEQPLYLSRAREGARTNMRAVFEAVAHRNPYPAERFDENAWNHLVLKALFVGSALHPIIGLDRRANAELASMLRDYAHERWAAGRPVSHELWRCVGRFGGPQALADLERVAATGSEVERAAAALALADSGSADAGALLERAAPDAAKRIHRGELSWQALARATA